MRILLVEDTVDLGDAVQATLKKSGYAVDWVIDGDDALTLIDAIVFDVIILDVMLPGRDGFSILEHLRRKRDKTPVLIITARSEIDDKVSLLDLGADDYLVKPFDLRELTARVRALMRRPLGIPASTITFGNLVLDTRARTVEVDGRRVTLMRRELGLLEILLGNINAPVTKERLLDQLFSLDDEVAPNAVEVYVSRLRKKLDGAEIEILTHRGEGYSARLRDSA